MKATADKLFKGENPDILKELREVLDGDLDTWLDTPNERFMGRAPRELIGTSREIHVRNWIRRVKHGIPT